LPLTDKRDAEAHRMLNIIFHIASYGNQTISSTRTGCWIHIWTVGVINSCPTTIRSLRHSLGN